MVKAFDKWWALAQAMKFFFDEKITASEFKDADKNARATKEAWWEEEVHAPYSIYEDGEIGSCGGWLMAVPTGVPGIYQVYKF